MNVIISNKKTQMLENLNIEIIKEMTGEFDVEEIINNFKNFFFQRMILDITALKNYTDIMTIQKLSLALDMNKVILVLDEESETVSPEFMSKLISIGIYNFTTNLEGIMYLYNSPNSYRDVAHLHVIEQPIINQTNDSQSNTVYVDRYIESDDCKVIGFKNITKQAGSTTLIYMLKKQLEKYYKVAAIEVEKSDFRFLNDRSLISATNSNIGNVINKNKTNNIILLDINNSENAIGLCNDVIYLIEPSIIKLNRLMVINPRLLTSIQGKKVVLNQSLLNNKDISDFEYETKVKIFYNIGPLNDRANNYPELVEFLHKLGFMKVN